MTSYPVCNIPFDRQDIDDIALEEAEEIKELIRFRRYGVVLKDIESPKDKLGFKVMSRLTRLIRRVFNY